MDIRDKKLVLVGGAGLIGSHTSPSSKTWYRRVWLAPIKLVHVE